MEVLLSSGFGDRPLFSFRIHQSPEEERQLAEDTDAYNGVKDSLDTMTNLGRHATVKATYDNLMMRHKAKALERKQVEITVFGKSLRLTASTPSGI